MAKQHLNLPSLRKHASNNVKHIFIDKSSISSSSAPLGFSIRGGSEYGVGIYISHVEKSLPAETYGFQIGDQILSVNKIQFTDISLSTAIKIIKNSTYLDFELIDAGVGIDTIDTQTRYEWINRLGKKVSPPPVMSTARRYSLKDHHTDSGITLTNQDEKKVTISASGMSIGLSIRGGIEFGLGIYISGVDKNSVAERAGLKLNLAQFTVELMY